MTSPRQAARLVFVPFKIAPWPWLESLQIGGSLTQSKIDLSNVALEVKSSGMGGTTRSIFVLNQNTKFGLLQNVKERDRWALEAGWSLGPLAVQGEYLNLKYKDLESSGGHVQDADFSSWYGSILLFFTGESPIFKEGVLQPVKPKNNLDLSAGTWGGLGLAVRADHFSRRQRLDKGRCLCFGRKGGRLQCGIELDYESYAPFDHRLYVYRFFRPPAGAGEP